MKIRNLENENRKVIKSVDNFPEWRRFTLSDQIISMQPAGFSAGC